MGDGGFVNRDTGLCLVRERVANENLVRHMLATEAIMGALAERLGDDVERWKLAGLLHDLDVEQTAESMETHGTLTVQWLREEGLDDEEVLRGGRGRGRRGLRQVVEVLGFDVDVGHE